MQEGSGQQITPEESFRECSCDGDVSAVAMTCLMQRLKMERQQCQVGGCFPTHLGGVDLLQIALHAQKTVQNGKVLGRYSIPFLSRETMNYQTLPVLVAGQPQGDQARKEDSPSQSKRCRWGDKGLENIACFTCMLWRRLLCVCVFFGWGQNNPISPDCDYVKALLWGMHDLKTCDISCYKWAIVRFTFTSPEWLHILDHMCDRMRSGRSTLIIFV